MKRKVVSILLTVCIAISLVACGNSKEEIEAEVIEEKIIEEKAAEEIIAEPEIIEAVYDNIAVEKNGAGVSVHDPSIKVYDGRYYIYGSHMTGAYSDDMKTWTYIGNTYKSNNPLFEDLFAEDIGIFDYAGGVGKSYSVWAEDVIYNEVMGKYVMYFCTSSTYIKSDLCFATADSPDGPFAWQGNLLYSGFTPKDIDQTNVYDYVSEEYAAKTYLKLKRDYNNDLWPNCIDPAPFYDEDGRMWITYGSWSGGIFLIEVDVETGLLIHPEADEENNVDPYFGKRLMGGGHISIEGPYIQYDSQSGYYYLYVSYGALQREGGYQIRVFRSKTVDGEYLDMNGKCPGEWAMHNNYGLKLSGNYNLPSLKDAYMATGGQSTFQDTDGKHYICYHTRFKSRQEYHEPCVKQIFYNEEGWPVLAPYRTAGETLSDSGYSMEEMAGTYYFINQGTEIDKEIAQPVMITLNEDGTVSGSIRGTWTVKEGSSYIHLTYQEKEYSGVFCAMKDQAGTPVMTFTAAGSNESIWGVKY